uniref:Uncharacterized protein n=1 Tax=Geospiza parvula TaxID=87175 RepID=A0A8C3NCS6_GEOPR
MPWPHPAVPSPTLALAGWCPLSPTGAQTTQLHVEPPWRPAVLWDRVTLTCQGSGTAGATTWYKDGWRWWVKAPSHITVTVSGTYTEMGPSCPTDDLVLQVPAWVLLEGDKVTLRCRCRHWKHTVTGVRFFWDEKDLGESVNGTELSLSSLQLNQSGSYSCEGLHPHAPPQGLKLTDPPPLSCPELFSVPVPLRPRAPLLHVFYRDGQVVGGPQGSLQLTVPGQRGDSVAESDPLNVTVLGERDPRAGGRPHPWHPHPTSPSASPVCVPAVPVANATIHLSPLSHQLHPGDSMALRCSVQVGSAPVTFTWLHNGQEVAQGPLLELRDIDVGHSGTYQCVATNELDGHQALSPELALKVTPWGHRDTGKVTQGHQGGSAPWDPTITPPLFVCSCQEAPGKVSGCVQPLPPLPPPHNSPSPPKHPLYPHRAPLEPLAPPQEGEVLYTHVMSTKQAQREYCGWGGQ